MWEILEEAKLELITMVMRSRHVKRRYETENIRAVVEMKMKGKRPRGRPKLRWKDTVLSCHMYWPTLQWSQTVRDGAHGPV